jgi:chromosome segregation ATPase
VKLSRRWLVTAGAVLFAAPIARGVERDSLLEEVRALRRDLHAVAVVAQRIQLLVYRVHVQTEVVRRAKERHEQAKSNLELLENNLTQSAGSIRLWEETLRSESDRARKQALEIQLEYGKAEYKGHEASLPKLQAEAADAEREYSTEQAKLDGLQSRLDLLERQLEGLSASLVR